MIDDLNPGTLTCIPLLEGRAVCQPPPPSVIAAFDPARTGEVRLVSAWGFETGAGLGGGDVVSLRRDLRRIDRAEHEAHEVDPATAIEVLPLRHREAYGQ
jgi:hypothetical protein